MRQQIGVGTGVPRRQWVGREYRAIRKVQLCAWTVAVTGSMWRTKAEAAAPLSRSGVWDRRSS